jgi:lysophospholipase L1-like esterase
MSCRRWVATAALLTAACGGHSPGPSPVSNPPQITCPADVAVHGVTGASQAVSYDPPAVTGGTQPVNVTCAKPSGSTFPLGTTSVSCAAADGGGRQATCSFNVILSGQALSVSKFDAIGDSFTAGENGLPATLDVPNSYPVKLQADLDSLYPGQAHITIQARPGERVEQTVDRIPGIMAADRPEAVLLLSGFNNLTQPCPPGRAGTTACGQAIDDVGFGVRDCIRRVKEANVGVKYIFASTLTPPGRFVSGPGVTDRRIDGDAIVRANQRIRQMVANERAILVDPYPAFVGHEADYVSVDGLHLQPAGYQVLADTFFAAIMSNVAQTPLSNALR